MKIASLCRRRIIIITTTTTTTTEASERPRFTGVVTDPDLVIDVLARGLSVASVAIGDLSSHRVASVSEDDDHDQAISAMQQSGVRCLLVVDAAAPPSDGHLGPECGVDLSLSLGLRAISRCSLLGPVSGVADVVVLDRP